MNKSPEELALAAYLASITEKKARVSDNHLLSIPITLSKRGKNGWTKKHEQGNIKRRNDESLKNTFNEVAKNRKENNLEWRENHNSAMIMLAQTEEWQEKHKVLNYKGKKKKQPIMTDEGPFVSRIEAAKHFNVTPQIIDRRKNKYPDVYYYISQEEYIMLTGKDI